jgi:hypothetical protein
VARGGSVVSPNAEIEATQLATKDRCRVEVKRSRAVLWTADRCLGDRDDLHFISNDGQDLLVFFALLQKSGNMKQKLAVELWHHGEIARRFEVGRFVQDTKTLIESARHFYWCEGAMGQPGVPPGYSKDGKAVEVTTLDRRSWSISFDGTVKKIAMPTPLGR